MQWVDLILETAGGSNAYIWASWAFLEAKLGKVAFARQLYDASTVAEPSHAAAWHGWGLLEKKEGHLLRARDLWLKVGMPPYSGIVPCTLRILHCYTVLSLLLTKIHSVLFNIAHQKLTHSKFPSSAGCKINCK